MKRLMLAMLALALGSAESRAQKRVTVADLGPGESGRILEAALAQPHRLIEPDTGWFVLRRNEREQTTLIVLGRSAAIAGAVGGDVIVVGGDLYARPGAHISGQAVAIGGGVYPSTFAVVGKGSHSFRDNTFTILRTQAGYRLEYRSLREHASPSLLFPLIYGLRAPSYDRVNGASLPFGPALTFAGGRGEVDMLATYRSDLGKIDPSLDGNVQLTRRARATTTVQQGTFTNDAWIWSQFVNSFSVLGFGIDTRNYYRADRAELTIHRLWESARTQIEPFLGGLSERAWSVGPGVGERRGPWSVVGRTDSLGMWRPNPAINAGTITSVLTGSTLQWESDDFRLRARSRGEISVSSPSDKSFAQVTSDLVVTFPTFGEQEYALDVHWMTTLGDTAPLQRFAFLGGAGTLPFSKLLEQGGDELLLIDQRYSVPLVNVRLGILGIPTLLLRHRLGSAGLGGLPALEQLIGTGVMLTIARAELQFDPARGKARVTAGFSFSR